jgi:hypothetical protein
LGEGIVCFSDEGNRRFGFVSEVVGVAVTSHPFGTVAVMRFDVAFGSLNNEGAVCSNGEASLDACL